MSQMAQQEYGRLKKALASERLKTNATGAVGVLTGIGVGEAVGGLVGAAAGGGKGINNGASAFTKLILGVVVLFFNGMTGLAGLFIMGMGWGILGSIVTDVVATAADGATIQELGAKGHAKLYNAYKQAARSAQAQTSIKRAQQMQREVTVTSQQAADGQVTVTASQDEE